MDAAEYKHVVLGLIFLKYISDSFEEHHAKLLAGEGEYAGGNPEDPDEYRAENIFWVPPAARWTYLQNSAKQPAIGKIVDDAMVAIERDNPRLKGILPKDYARPALDKNRLGELIDLIGTIGMGDEASRSKDILGRVYEYFLSRFASAEGKKGGQFYTPQSVVRLLVEMLAPYKGRVYDPCCGSGGMFVQSEKFVEAHGGRLGDISIYGQESNATTRRLAMMNLAIRGIEADLGEEQADTFRRDLHPDLRADFVLANPPFNDSDWFRKDDDARWQFGLPPRGNANFAWVQHFIYHLAPTGMAGFVLANGACPRIKAAKAKSAAPSSKPTSSTAWSPFPASSFIQLRFLSAFGFFRGTKQEQRRFRDRRRQTLFIDARKLGHLVDRVHRELSGEEIQRIAQTYHAWRGTDDSPRNPHSELREYADVQGFCKSVTTDEIVQHGGVLTPGRYVGAEEVEDEGEPFEQKMTRLTSTLRQELAESARLEREVLSSLTALGL